MGSLELRTLTSAQLTANWVGNGIVAAAPDADVVDAIVGAGTAAADADATLVLDELVAATVVVAGAGGAAE